MMRLLTMAVAVGLGCVWLVSVWLETAYEEDPCRW
jgi:hypothetical protein